MAEPVQQRLDRLLVNGELIRVDHASTEKPLIIMVHGTLGHHNMEIMRSLRELFYDQGYSSLSVSLSLGLNDRKGMYDCSIPHTHKHEDALDEIDGWISWAQKQGFPNVVLMGHSRGGNQIAWYVAQSNRPNVSAVVLLAPTIDKGISKEQSLKIAESYLGAASKVAAGNQDDWYEDIDFLHCKNAKVSAGSLASYYVGNRNFDTLWLLSQIEVPVLVISGSEDKVVPRLAEKIKLMPENHTPAHVEIQASDHFFRDLNANEVVESTVEFLQGL